MSQTPVEEIRRAAQLMRKPDDIPRHISAWRRKDVQLAVADWLRAEALDAAYDLANATGNTTNFVEQHYHRALKVARAYLGGAT